jgi:hypothetical protein
MLKLYGYILATDETKALPMNDFRQKVPSDRYQILDYTTNIAFKAQGLGSFIRSAFQLGYSRLGDIVQLSEVELKSLAVTHAAFLRIKEILAANRLDISMEAPGWQNPDTQKQNTSSNSPAS